MGSAYIPKNRRRKKSTPIGCYENGADYLDEVTITPETTSELKYTSFPLANSNK